MKTVYLVKDEEAAFARSIESRLLELPESSGILFVGVEVTPASDKDQTVYTVFVGGRREYDAALFHGVVHQVFLEEIRAGVTINVEVRRGVTRRLGEASQVV